MTVKELLVRMDSVELTKQMAYDMASDEKWCKEYQQKKMYRAAMKENGIEGEIQWGH